MGSGNYLDLENDFKCRALRKMPLLLQRYKSLIGIIKNLEYSVLFLDQLNLYLLLGSTLNPLSIPPALEFSHNPEFPIIGTF
jgi:hypothetical protein